MQTLLCVGAGGFLGAISRYGLSQWLRAALGGSYPLGTLAVNVLGCLGIGALLGLSQESTGLSENTRLVLVVGLLGSFTTFSTFGHETLRLFGEDQLGRALLNVGLNLVLGLGAVWLGALWAQGAN
jgi:CrcB protein